jgi:hypothetical protein
MDTLQHDKTTESMAKPVLELATRKRSTKHMKELFSGVAIIAALAIAAPASAQRTGPGPDASTTTGPGVIPPGGFGPSSPLFNLPLDSPGVPGAAPAWMAPVSAPRPLPPGTVPSRVPVQSP